MLCHESQLQAARTRPCDRQSATRSDPAKAARPPHARRQRFIGPCQRVLRKRGQTREATALPPGRLQDDKDDSFETVREAGKKTTVPLQEFLALAGDKVSTPAGGIRAEMDPAGVLPGGQGPGSLAQSGQRGFVFGEAE